jgi:homopolymeric O-antigen transport system ATP-binding protein
MAVAIRVDGLSKQYRIGQFNAAYGTLRDTVSSGAQRVMRREGTEEATRDIWALKDVSFQVSEGEVLGIIGRNGAGKSTLLKILTRITTPTEGRAEIHGRVGSLLEVGTGFHPELTGRENIFLNGSILGMRRGEIKSKFDDIVEFSGVEKFLDTPVKRYSSGMYVRLAFSVAAYLEPEVLLVDEVLAVGDFEFQRRCLGRMEDLSQSGRTVIFVSHNLQAVSRLCDRAVLLQGGVTVTDGPSRQVVAEYLQSNQAGGSHREWPVPATAPGNSIARLRWVRVVDEAGETVSSVDVRKPVGIEIAFGALRGGKQLTPKIKVVDQQGDVAFNAIDTDLRWRIPAEKGDYVSTAWIPGNLLSEGLFTVDVSIVTTNAPKLMPHAGALEVLSFHVHDPLEGDSARGNYMGQPWRGVVSPLLEWTTREQ